MMKKILILLIFILTTTFVQSATSSNSKSILDSPVIGQEVRGINLQQLEYRQVKNTNDNLKNQRLESTNMEIVGDTIKRQRQRIKVVQSDEIELYDEVTKGKKENFFKSIFK